MSSTELALRTPHNVEDMARIAKMLVVSGYFETDRDQAKAIAQMATKILAGAELGFGPWASVTGIHVIQGKPVLGANLMAAAVKANPRYDYRVRQNDDKGVSIEFFERVDGKLSSLGVSSFTQADAAAAGLATNANWKKFFRNMAFARAMSNGVRWYCPDVFSGAVVYSGDELGPTVDGETGEILPPPPQPPTQPGNGMTTTARIKGEVHEVPFMEDDEPEPEPVDPEIATLRKEMHVLGKELYADAWDDKRHYFAEQISAGATRSSKDLKANELRRMIAGMKAKQATQQPAGLAQVQEPVTAERLPALATP